HWQYENIKNFIYEEFEVIGKTHLPLERAAKSMGDTWQDTILISNPVEGNISYEIHISYNPATDNTQARI
ncbi:MAG: hypothetical protein P8Z67_03830, partial [Gammaproteobacteria bacterium]